MAESTSTALPSPPARTETSGRVRLALPRRTVRGIVGVLVFAAIAEAITRAEIVNPAFLPPFSEMVAEAVRLLGESEFRADVWATLRAWGLGMLLVVAVAVPVGVVLGSWHVAYRMSRAVIELMRPIPAVALIPLAILLYGQGTQMKVSLVLYAGVWPVLFNTIYGVHDVDPLMKETARSFGLSRFAVLRRVTLPSAAPFIATGIRVASSIALMMVITTELIGTADGGIGAFMAQAQASGVQSLLVYAATIVAGVLGLLLNTAMASLERRLFAWQPQARG